MKGTVRDRALFVDGALVVADLHVGKGASANLELPVGDGGDVLDRFEALLDRFDPDEAVVAGDLLHSFRTIPRTVREVVDGLADLAAARDVPLVVTPGNHDTMLDEVWDGPTASEYRVGDTVICHGHEPPEAEADRYVVGHDHPTIEIEGQRRPCFLSGRRVYEETDVVMLPPFNRLVRGVRVNDMGASDFHSPLVCEAGAFRPIVRDEDGDETLTFPPLGEFRQLL